MRMFFFSFFFFQAEDGIRDLVRSRGLGDVYKRQFVDRVGKRAILMLTSALVLACVHIFLGQTNGVEFTGHVDQTTAEIDIPWIRHPAVGLTFMGIAYSFLSLIHI
eukprot:TRINITY_DN22606_c0_g1_i1.p1 TRINITY_DN22606_c0_g1~~TRINITY_DN22606_c0_g1_i1.p1  ORF type:complete len:106 (+),score=44.95 TRINITY_DN22606_c0_g1_i1:42-359(+)